MSAPSFGDLTPRAVSVMVYAQDTNGSSCYATAQLRSNEYGSAGSNDDQDTLAHTIESGIATALSNAGYTVYQTIVSWEAWSDGVAGSDVPYVRLDS